MEVAGLVKIMGERDGKNGERLVSSTDKEASESGKGSGRDIVRTGSGIQWS